MHFDEGPFNGDAEEPENQPPANDDRARDNDGETGDDLIDILGSEPLPRPRSSFASRFVARTTEPTVFCIENAADRSMTFRVVGRRPYRSHRMTGWQVNFGSLNVQMNDLGRFIAAYHAQENESGRAAWRHTAQQIGQHLYRGLLDVDPTLARRLLNLRRWTRPAGSLTLLFDGPRDYLSVPYELLHDNRAPLVVDHALCRRLPDYAPHSDQTFAVFIDDLQRTESPLRVLLIASDGPDSASEGEASAVYNTLAERAAALGLPIEIDVLAGDDVRLDAVRVKLTQCAYHVVHYAGQLYQDPDTPENSGLLFSGNNAAQLGQELLTLAELDALLHDNRVQLFFVSAPISPQTWNAFTLQDRDYLDVLALLARRGIPYTVGFRWYVTESSKQRFATLFYEHLLANPAIPERAVLRARHSMYDFDPHDETWASPLLIAQTPHGLPEGDE